MLIMIEDVAQRSFFASRDPLLFAEGLISTDADFKLIFDFLKSLLVKSLRIFLKLEP